MPEARRSSRVDPLAVNPHELFLDRVRSLRDNVTAYDAIHVALAEALRDSLVTGDRELAGSPGPNVRLELVWPDSSPRRSRYSSRHEAGCRGDSVREAAP